MGICAEDAEALGIEDGNFVLGTDQVSSGRIRQKIAYLSQRMHPITIHSVYITDSKSLCRQRLSVLTSLYGEIRYTLRFKLHGAGGTHGQILAAREEAGKGACIWKKGAMAGPE